jgi:hypothetical protein
MPGECEGYIQRLKERGKFYLDSKEVMGLAEFSCPRGQKHN